MERAIIDNLLTRTGKSIDDWSRLVESEAPHARKDRIQWLRKRHKLGGPTATIIAAACEGKSVSEDYDDQDGLIEAMYIGKEDLRSIYERIASSAKRLGEDVELAARKTYVSISRKRQFAAIQPSAKSRVDLGLVLPATPVTKRLLPSKTVGGGRITHRIALEKDADFDSEAKSWLRRAYNGDSSKESP